MSNYNKHDRKYNIQPATQPQALFNLKRFAWTGRKNKEAFRYNGPEPNGDSLDKVINGENICSSNYS